MADLRAIDLYCGVGGWGLGLELAGIDVVESYEWWNPAIDTHAANLGRRPRAVNIRELDLSELPKDIDIVVGSPPCTQFSYANRGGGGDLSDGIKDIAKFFEVVEYLKPRYWILENVPRISKILKDHVFTKRGKLRQYAHLFDEGMDQICLVDASKFGVPQRRKRCLVGVFPRGLFESYQGKCDALTLGDVLHSLQSEKVIDPIYGIRAKPFYPLDNDVEDKLSDEEARMNRDAKQNHPVYNSMSFPDRLDRPSRTIAATCTRVSRESIIVREKPRSKSFRRLTLRERATLQGFPVTYQFLGRSYGEKVKLIGNAMPPPLAYFLGLSMVGVPDKQIMSLRKKSAALPMPVACSIKTSTEGMTASYPKRRRFCAAIPGLHFKSGVRFELGNDCANRSEVTWAVRFFYGSSKDIRSIEMSRSLRIRLERFKLCKELSKRLESLWSAMSISPEEITPHELQNVWSRRDAGVSPYKIVDQLGGIAKELITCETGENSDEAYRIVCRIMLNDAKVPSVQMRSQNPNKLRTYAVDILVGLLIGCRFNEALGGGEVNASLLQAA
ncbi:C-5 cytosine-specific DNA methylase [Tepidicaulis marinus]|uniref:Cytosine-specific methyltransferase n=1 Tax=Tepidicaulis marinus TaxID=1333998 RepID=A0A081BFG7_9HYPH|nr:DNA (cytosine-5-)-methyltransferase [Tepidicaulis marinus]GAK46785.1 C-5 cytosine-specific DNA methylase [Tepidicaulis marinus]